MGINLDDNDKLFEKVYADFKEQLRYAENKNNILVTVLGVLFIPIFTIFSVNELRTRILASNLMLSFWVISIILGFSIFLFFSISCMPRTNIKMFRKVIIEFNLKKSKKNQEILNIFFYKWWINNYDDCERQLIKEYQIKDPMIFNQIVKQIYDYAFLINRKYLYSKIIIWVFFVFILFFLVSFFLLLFL